MTDPDTSLPAESHFRTLLANIQQSPDHIIVNDPKNNISATHARFLHDVLHFREKVRGMFREKSLVDEDGVVYEGRPYVLVMGPASYYFLVGFYAVLALGGAPAVICEIQPEREGGREWSVLMGWMHSTHHPP